MTDHSSAALPRIEGDSTQTGQFDARLYNKLREVIHDAAADQPQLPVFLERLNSHGAQLLAQISRAGRVTGVNYAYLGFQIKSATLGTEYTWSGLQRKLGVHYIAQRDNPLLAVEALISDGDGPTAGVDAAARQGMLPLDEESSPWSLADDDASDATTPVPAIETARGIDAPEPAFAATADPALIAAAEEVADALAMDLDEADAFTPDDGTWEGIAEDLADDASAQASFQRSAAPASVGASSVTHEAIDNGANQALMTELRDAIARLEDVRPQPVAAVDTKAIDRAVSEAHALVAAARQEVTRARLESWRLAAISAAIAGLIAALVVGLWMGQRSDRAVARAIAGLTQHIDQLQANDPVRAYFEKLVKKQGGAAK